MIRNIIEILLIVGFALVVWIWRREIAGFIRTAISPQWNNRILLVLWILCLLLLLNAIYQGGGEPLSLQALREIGRPGQESPIVRYYAEADRYFTGAEYPQTPAPPPHHGTWFWWHLWLFSLVIAILYIPFAFWDELSRAWHRAVEAHEQRRRRFNLRPPQPPPQAAPEQPVPQPRPETFWGRFRERFFAAISADMLWDFGENAFRAIVRRRIR